MRRQRPRGTTRPEAVVDAALKVVDEVGVDGLTIRAVAGLVGAPPMSLYTHFDNKEGLLDFMNAEISRRHNNANILCFAADLLGDELIRRIIDAWLLTPFEQGRHARRVEKLMLLEKQLFGETPEAALKNLSMGDSVANS